MWKAISRKDGEQGRSLLSIAAIVAVSAVVVVGLLEFSWFVFQNRNVNDAAEEGARLAAGNFGTPTQIGQQVCDSIDIKHPTAAPEIILRPSGSNAGIQGDRAEITVTSRNSSMTGVLDPIFGRVTLQSTISFELTRPPQGQAIWWADGQTSTHVC